MSDTQQAGEVEFSLALSPDTRLVGGDPSDVMGAPAVMPSASVYGTSSIGLLHITRLRSRLLLQHRS